MIRKIQEFDYKYPFGKIIPLEEFLFLVSERKITPQGGTISEVIINGYVTNILIQFWDMYRIDDDYHIMNLIDLEDVGGKVEILWIEKRIR